ncbi:hypothetical protein DF186_19160, partial [Enterococcus hirae]
QAGDRLIGEGQPVVLQGPAQGLQVLAFGGLVGYAMLGLRLQDHLVAARGGGVAGVAHGAQKQGLAVLAGRRGAHRDGHRQRHGGVV